MRCSIGWMDLVFYSNNQFSFFIKTKLFHWLVNICTKHIFSGAIYHQLKYELSAVSFQPWTYLKKIIFLVILRKYLRKFCKFCVQYRPLKTISSSFCCCCCFPLPIKIFFLLSFLLPKVLFMTTTSSHS